MQAIETKYFGPSNVRESRIKATTSSGISTTIPYPDELTGIDAHWQAAHALCKKLGWDGTFTGAALKNSFVFVFVESYGRETERFKVK